MSAIAYVTDVEGLWEKLATFAAGNPLVTLEPSGRLVVREGALLVFGGDAVDRGPHGRRVLATLLEAKTRQPSSVVLLAGNRDINKLRLARELTGFPQPKTPPEMRAAPRPTLLRWIFERTMNARAAFENRRTELAASGLRADDDAVTASFLEDLAPDGLLCRYLLACQLAFVAGGTLFVHGAVTEDNVGIVPGAKDRIADLRAWVERLNAWYRSQIEAFIGGDRTVPDDPPWQPVVRYQAPLPGMGVNPESVVYSRTTDAIGNPLLPTSGLVATLARSGIDRLVVGHTPSGDTPAVLRDERFELIMADNSYGRLERGSKVLLTDESTRVASAAQLDDGRVLDVTVDLARDDAGTPIGRRDLEHGHLVKGTLATGELLLFRSLPGYRFEQLALEPRAAATKRLAVPR